MHVGIRIAVVLMLDGTLRLPDVLEQSNLVTVEAPPPPAISVVVQGVQKPLEIERPAVDLRVVRKRRGQPYLKHALDCAFVLA